MCTRKYLVIFALLRLNCTIVIWKIYYRFKVDILVYSLYVYRRKEYDDRSKGFSSVLYDILGSNCNEYEGYCNLVCDAVWFYRNLLLFRYCILLHCWRWRPWISKKPWCMCTYYTSYARYAVVQLVEALRYKSEGRGFDSPWCHWNFSLT
jgi:hypothetical protein